MINAMFWIIQKPSPQPHSMENLSSMKFLPGAQKVGDYRI